MTGPVEMLGPRGRHDRCHRNDGLARDFIDLPFRIYKDSDRWVPWFRGDVKRILRSEHPLFDHSFGEFFVATEGRETVGQSPRY